MNREVFSEPRQDDDPMLDLYALLKEGLEQDASDLMIKVGNPPIFRVHGKIRVASGSPIQPEEAEHLAEEAWLYSSREHLLRLRHRANLPSPLEEGPLPLSERKEMDLVFTVPGLCRVRANLFLQQATIALAFRLIPLQPRTIDELLLPAFLKELAQKRSGLILVTGPTGSGKTTTLAAIIEHINQNWEAQIITIEDPNEYLFQEKKSIILQRDVGTDTRSFSAGIRSALRQSPDVIMVGEMRDLTTIEAVLSAAEVGHLVLSTLHTTTAPAAIDRLINAFPPHHKPQIVTQLVGNLQGVIAQRLIPRADGKGRIPAVEIMVATPTVCKLIEEGNTADLHQSIREGAHYGMISMNQSLEKLVRGGIVTMEEALLHSPNPQELRQLLRH